MFTSKLMHEILITNHEIKNSVSIMINSFIIEKMNKRVYSPNLPFTIFIVWPLNFSCVLKLLSNATLSWHNTIPDNGLQS